jgi:hypothetical protein
VSTAAARGDDATAFYAADLGETRALAASTIINQNTDVQGAFTPGRYLIQALGMNNPNTLVWIIVGAFVAGSPLTGSAVPGLRRFPLSARGMVAIETNILKGDSDRIAVITSVGTATVYVSRISRGA